jgi:hypothetical protein
MHQQADLPAAAPQKKTAPQLVHTVVGTFSADFGMVFSILSREILADPALNKARRHLR